MEVRALSPVMGAEVRRVDLAMPLGAAQVEAIQDAFDRHLLLVFPSQRIDEAANYLPLERLGISPQCGFSSGGGAGQAVTQDDTRRKLELVLEVAREVWGSPG